MSVTLTETEAYKAMFAYLAKVYETTKSDDLGGLLGSMCTLPSGETADPAIWEEWLKCINDVKKGNIDTAL